MSKIIKTFELERYSEPDGKGQAHKIGMANAKEIFDKLYAHLEENNLLPDEYFLFNDGFSYYKGELPEFSDVICHTNFEGSEGIYIDIFLRTGRGIVSFATGKTLAETADDFYKMSRIAAECSLMLNGMGATFELSNKEKNVIEYKLNKNESTTYIILERKKNMALLKRLISNPINDPTPYIVVSGLTIKENNLIGWDFGTYCSNISSAINDYLQKSNSLYYEKLRKEFEKNGVCEHDIELALNACKKHWNSQDNEMTASQLRDEIINNGVKIEPPEKYSFGWGAIKAPNLDCEDELDEDLER